MPVVDMTPVVTAIEPAHDYSHAASTGGAQRLGGVEFRMNGRLFRGCKYFTTVDATHLLTPDGFARPPVRNKISSLLVRAEYGVYFMLKGTLYPYSSPLIAVARMLKSAVQALPGGGKVRRT
jgi:hypothetical protein